MAKLSLEGYNPAGKKVLVRVDFNVPLDDKQKVTDQTRIVAVLPTIKYLVERKAKVILMSHLGRPKGKPDDKAKFSLKPVAEKLSEILKKPVLFAEDCIGDAVKSMINGLKDGDIILLENLRFHKEEEANDEGFSKQLASLGDAYVNDAFGTAHRAHASTAGVTKFIKPCMAGFLLNKELSVLSQAMDNPQRPFVAILGGAKISDKIEVIKNLLNKVDTLIVGGGMAYTFFKAMGREVGKSLLEAEKVDLAKEIMKEAEQKKVNFLLPVDNVIADRFDPAATVKIQKGGDIPADWQGLDIGPDSIKLFGDTLKNAKTVIWNGPMGAFEMAPFAKGTLEVAKVLAGLKATTIIGGGDSAAAITKMGLADKMTHICTGGGASLEFLEGKELPGVAALTDK